jgi:Sigma-70, region 4
VPLRCVKHIVAKTMGKRGPPFAAELPGIELRNAEIIRRYEAGEELASIGVSLDLTRERIRQIVRSAGARMPREYKCAVPDCFRSPRSPGRYCFAHQRRLDRYGDPLGVRPLLRETHGTAACYVVGCRCDLCRKAGAPRRRVEAERQREHEHRRHPEMRRYTRRRSG